MDAVNLWLSTVLGDSGIKRLSENNAVVLVPQEKSDKIKTTATENKISETKQSIVEPKIAIDKVEEPKTEEKILEKSIIDDKVLDESLVQKVKECFNLIEKELDFLYQKYFNKKQDFKPTLSNVLGDVLYYLAHKSTAINKDKEFEKIFNVNPKNVGEKYKNSAYIPFAFNLTVWVDKKLKSSHSIEVLNGLSGVLFTLYDDENNDEIIIKELSAITKLLEDEKLI